MEHHRSFRSHCFDELGREGRGGGPCRWTTKEKGKGKAHVGVNEVSVFGGSSPPRPEIEDWFAPRQTPIPPHGETNDVIETFIQEEPG